jgi:protocatechuate 3,4-dioxygenase beta subunit
MNRIINFLLFVSLFNFLTCCNGQTKTDDNKTSVNKDNVGGGFENREFTYYGIPKTISATDTSSGWKQNGQKLLLTGIVYQIDGKIPAPDVLLYYYQTNTDGKYLHKPEESRSMPPNELGQTHGYIRGWVKTDSLGRYFIYTVRPGVYPTREAPAHIHITVKEPNDINEYYIDDFVFDDDKLVNTEYRNNMDNRCGSGVLRLVNKEDLFIGERNIILGLNIPNYPTKPKNEISSGKNIGEDVVSFIPYHSWGPDKGTRTCPICKYGWYHGILYFVGNNPNWAEIKQWLAFLEQQSIKREKYLKVYFVYGKENDYNKIVREKELEKIGKELNLEKVALTFVPSFSDSESEVNLNKINQNADNTFIIYKRSRIVDKFINLKPTETNYNLLIERLDQTINEYFDLPKTKQE